MLTMSLHQHELGQYGLGESNALRLILSMHWPDITVFSSLGRSSGN
jgi:hypothetical protein